MCCPSPAAMLMVDVTGGAATSSCSFLLCSTAFGVDGHGKKIWAHPNVAFLPDSTIGWHTNLLFAGLTVQGDDEAVDDYDDPAPDTHITSAYCTPQPQTSIPKTPAPAPLAPPTRVVRWERPCCC